MKTVLRALLCMAFLSAHVVPQQADHNQQPEDKAKQELLDLENHWLAVEGDPEALESILASDFLHVVPAGIITKSDQLNFMRKHPARGKGPQKHFDDLHVRVYGGVGIVNGVVVEGTARVTRKTLFTDVFAYRDGRWQAANAQELPIGDRAR